MTKRLAVVLALAVGVVLGYAARDLPFNPLRSQGNETETTNSDTSPSNTLAPEAAGPVSSASPTEGDLATIPTFPATDTVLDYVLPVRSLAQLRIDAAEIRGSTSEESLQALVSDEVAQEVFVRMSEYAHPSFGKLIGALAGNAKSVYLFLLPGKGEIPVPGLLVVAKWPHVSQEDVHQCLRDPVMAGLEDSETYSESVGDFTLEGVRAPTGNVSYVVTREGVWICNSAGALREIFTMESVPTPEEPPPLQSLLAKVPGGPVVATLNLQPQPDRSAGPSGFLALLAGLGIERIAIGWGGTPASLAAFGSFTKTPSWAKEWPPLDTSRLQTSTGGSLAVLDASLPPAPAGDYLTPMPGGFRPRGGPERIEFGQPPDDRRQAPRERQAEPRPPRTDVRRMGLQSPVLAATRFVPPAQSVSIRLAPGEEEPVVWSVTFQGDSERLSEWCKQLESAPWCQTEDAGSGLRRLTFEGGPLSMGWGVERLLISQGGNSLVFYSSEESSRLLSPPGGSTGVIVMESPSGETPEPSQVRAGVSTELLQLLILGEKESLDPEAPSSDAITSFFTVLGEFTSPLTLDLAILTDGVRVRVQAEHQMAAVLGPVLIASAFFRGGI